MVVTFNNKMIIFELNAQVFSDIISKKDNIEF